MHRCTCLSHFVARCSSCAKLRSCGPTTTVRPFAVALQKHHSRRHPRAHACMRAYGRTGARAHFHACMRAGVRASAALRVASEWFSFWFTRLSRVLRSPGSIHLTPAVLHTRAPLAHTFLPYHSSVITSLHAYMCAGGAWKCECAPPKCSSQLTPTRGMRCRTSGGIARNSTAVHSSR